MSEHLTLEQTLRQTAQIYLYERFLHPAAVCMNGFGNQFLSCTTLSGDQD